MLQHAETTDVTAHTIDVKRNSYPLQSLQPQISQIPFFPQ